jgi:anti-sigma B factor antagonist
VGAAVGEDTGPVRRAGEQAVVALPGHMDTAHAGQIREELLSVINGGAAALIADLTATASCDHAGADAVVGACQRAVISGTGLRLVVTAGHVSRVLSFSGPGHLVPVCPSLEAATAAGPAAAVLAAAAGPGLGGSRSWRESAGGYGR